MTGFIFICNTIAIIIMCLTIKQKNQVKLAD